jgi:hypothetical protein
MLATTKYENSTTESGEDNSDDETGGILDKVKTVNLHSLALHLLVRPTGRICQY